MTTSRHAKRNLDCLLLLAQETRQCAKKCEFDPFAPDGELDLDPEHRRFRVLSEQAQFLESVAADFDSLFVRSADMPERAA